MYCTKTLAATMAIAMTAFAGSIEVQSAECLPAFKGQCRKLYTFPSASMMPTVFQGEELEGDVNWYATHRPELGDVAVFLLPTDIKVIYLKRVVGLPGDRIRLIEGVLHINGRPVRRSRVEDFVYQTSSDGKSRTTVAQYEETLPNGVTYRILDFDDYGSGDDTDEYVVPDGHYFFLGDNRDNSHDSRYLSFMGYVPRENILVKARRITLSWNFLRIGKEIK